MKLSVLDFFQDFYDSQVFHPIIDGQDLKWLIIDTAYDSMCKIDNIFSAVDRDVFRKEMIAVRMEMVALAFIHKIKDMQQLLNQSAFTKRYLDENSHSGIWDIMGEYNQSIAFSSTKIADSEREENTIATMLNEMRTNLFEEYMKKYSRDGIDGHCITRICNREGSEVAWDNQVTIRYLMARLADRVGCDQGIDSDVLMAIASTIWGFYEGAEEAVKSIKFE